MTDATNIPASPHAKEAETKAVAKTATDAAVANDPHAVHAVNLSIKSPKVWASAAAGAAIGAPFGGPVGAAVGAVVGGAVAKFGIAGNPVGKVYDKIAGMLAKRGK